MAEKEKPTIKQRAVRGAITTADCLTTQRGLLIETTLAGMAGAAYNSGDNISAIALAGAAGTFLVQDYNDKRKRVENTRNVAYQVGRNAGRQEGLQAGVEIGAQLENIMEGPTPIFVAGSEREENPLYTSMDGSQVVHSPEALIAEFGDLQSAATRLGLIIRRTEDRPPTDQEGETLRRVQALRSIVRPEVVEATLCQNGTDMLEKVEERAKAYEEQYKRDHGDQTS